ncbi:MAG: CPBP family intramembrane metalloprotease [Planctomycetes bacterium]|nr:CPBP family intramembrane metalloprotease [Planctomycetota bacterium]
MDRCRPDPSAHRGRSGGGEPLLDRAPRLRLGAPLRGGDLPGRPLARPAAPACVPLAAAAITGLLFALVHPQGWSLIPVLATMGAILCLLRLWRGTLLAPIAAHALHNGILMALLSLVF